MSSFHPVLGLLAVAVCISFAGGAYLQRIQKDDIIVNKQHKTDLHQSLPSARDNGPLPSASHYKPEIFKRYDDKPNENFVDEGSYKSIKRADTLAKLHNLRSRDTDDVIAKADNEDSGSKGLGTDTQESEGVLLASGQSVSDDESSSEPKNSDDEKPKDSDESTLAGAVPSSGSEENCEDEEENNGQASSTPSSVSKEPVITSRPTRAPNEEDDGTSPDDECESESSLSPSDPVTAVTEPSGSEPTESSGSNPSESSSQSQDSQGSQEDDCNEGEETPPTTTPRQPESPTTKRRGKKPNDDNSSGSFNDSDSEGVEFSSSNSEESTGRSTELHD